MAVQQAGERHRADRVTYLASIAGAEAALRADDVTGARRQLERAPRLLRNWEWDYLYNRLDDSLARLLSHVRNVSSMGFSPDGSQLVTVGADNVARVWDHEKSDNAGELVLPESIATAVAWGPGRIRIVCATAEGSIEVFDWRPSTGELDTITFSLDSMIKKIEYLDEPSMVAVFSETELSIMEIPSGDLFLTRKLDDRDEGAAWPAIAPDLKQVAAAYRPGYFAILDLHSPERRVFDKKHDDLIEAILYSPDGAQLFTGSRDGTVRIWSVETGEQVRVLTGHSDQVRVLAITQDGAKIASAGRDRTIRVCDARTGDCTIALRGHETAIMTLRFAPSGKLLASGGTDGSVRIWDATLTTDPYVMRHTSYVYGTAISADGNRIATAGWDGYIGESGALRLWDAKTGSLIATWGEPGTVLTAIAFHPSKPRLAFIWTPKVGSNTYMVSILNSDTGQEMSDPLPLVSLAESIAFDPSSERIAISMGENLVRIWDVATGSMEQLPGEVVAYDKAGTLLATATNADPDQISIWDASTLQLKKEFGSDLAHVQSLAFNPDGTRVASASSDNKIRLWEIASGELLDTLVGHTDSVTCVTFNPNGSRIASASHDRTIRLWDTRTHLEVARFVGHASYVYSLAFSPDGSFLVSGSGDHTVRIWETRPLRERIQSRGQREMLMNNIEPFVNGLFAELGEVSAVVSQVRADTSLEDDEREIALQAVLRAGFQRRDMSQPSN